MNWPSLTAHRRHDRPAQGGRAGAYDAPPSELAHRSPVMPRRFAVATCPTGGARGATGWWATAARPVDVRPAQRTGFRSRCCRIGPMPPTEYGDLLDVVRESCGFIDFRDVADEARRFLCLPRAEPRRTPRPARTPVGSREAAQRLIAMSQPIRRTLVETYLHNRGIKAVHDAGALPFHPRCYYRGSPPTETRPAMIAAVTDRRHHRRASHLAPPDGFGKAPVDRRDEPWVISSAMPSALARPATSSQSAKASRRCDATALRCLPCRWRRALGQPPCRRSAPSDAASTLHRPRRRSRG